MVGASHSAALVYLETGKGTTYRPRKYSTLPGIDTGDTEGIVTRFQRLLTSLTNTISTLLLKKPAHHVDVPPTDVVPDVQPEIGRIGNVDLNIFPIQDEPLLMPGFSDETDIFILSALKEKVWNFEYVGSKTLLVI